ncbi:MAG: HAD family acid phosphatase, partial [Pseudomonadota bacterium]|nr:HAD family acid phosphatase [Pseudomonadota bacterium]
MSIAEKCTADFLTRVRVLLALGMALWLVACASSQRVKEDTPPPSHDPWNATALLSVLWMQDSAEYEAIAWQTYHSARRQLELSFATGSVPDPDRPPAVILDIDETVLLNTPFAAWLLLEGKRFDVADWTVWCKQEAADAVPGSVEFVQYLGKLGIHIVYITNRSLDVATATRGNLSRLGLTPNPDPDSGNVTYY